MLKICVAAAAFLGKVAVASNGSVPTSSLVLGDASFSPRSHSSGVSACEVLKEVGLKDRLLFPTDPGYEPQIETWWAENARLRPYCLVMPQTSQEVSATLTALLDVNDGAGNWHIAVRSGGHSVTGANNIVHGVTIDLSMMNSSSYDRKANVAKIEPGGRWKDVYANLYNHNVTVAGGRDGGVGVGGFLLGGGNNFFAGRVGFGCDTVVNFEVVLADGTIVNANSTANAGLWTALKGGSSNFGIVTRYDMEAIPARDLYYDLRILSSNYSEAVIDTVVGFANQDQSFGDNALFAYYTHDTSISPEISIAAAHVNILGNANAKTAFDKMKDLPVLANVTLLQSMAKAAAGSQLAAGTRNAGSTLTFLNNPDILRRCVEIHNEFVETLKRSIGADNFTTLMFFQPIPSYMAKISEKQGGNMLGLNDVHHNAIMWTGGVTAASDSALAIAQAELLVMTAKVKALSKSMHGDLDFIFLNYADASQDPLGSYGHANVQHMRDVAVKYDPTGKFQRRFPGGFKISRVV